MIEFRIGKLKNGKYAIDSSSGGNRWWRFEVFSSLEDAKECFENLVKEQGYFLGEDINLDKSIYKIIAHACVTSVDQLVVKTEKYYYIDEDGK